MMPAFICPVCKQPLMQQASQWRCSAGHSYDQAREGYLNLLLANRKNSRDPGDSAEMLVARREFLSADLYRFMPEAMMALIAEHVPKGGAKGALDLGCGEGYYSAILAEGLPELDWLGIDISKYGVRMAAKRYPVLAFAVASNFDLPLAPRSQVLAVQVFAPASVDEVCRVLDAGGLYLTVNPAADHLWGLKQHLYDTPREHDTVLLNDERLECVLETVIRREVLIDDARVLGSLFQMTPFFWHVGEQRQQELATQNSISTPFSFHLALYRRKPHQGVRYWESSENDSSTG